MSDATGMSPNTIRTGLSELATRGSDADSEVSSRLRKLGGGRKRLSETDPQLSVQLDRLVAPLTRGDPESALRWTCKGGVGRRAGPNRHGWPTTTAKRMRPACSGRCRPLLAPGPEALAFARHKQSVWTVCVRAQPCRIAFGPRAGQKVLTLQRALPRETKFNQTLCADMQGFSLHAAVRCDADDRQALE